MTSDRFLTLADVADTLNISASQTYALVRSGELQGIQIGGRNQWRVERTKLEQYIDEAYRRTVAHVEFAVDVDDTRAESAAGGGVTLA